MLRKIINKEAKANKQKNKTNKLTNKQTNNERCLPIERAVHGPFLSVALDSGLMGLGIKVEINTKDQGLKVSMARN